MKLDLPIIGKIEIPKWLEFPVLILTPVWIPFLVAFYLLRVVLWPVLSVILLYFVLPLACFGLGGILLGLPGLLIVAAFCDNPPNWLLVISVMPGGVGALWGLNLFRRIMDTDLFCKISFFKEEDIDKGVWEDFMNR